MIEEILKNCTIKDNVIYLPAVDLDRKTYTEVAKQLNLIGGKWKGGKVSGFVFNSNPTELLEQISGGVKKNIKKEFQFFPTPKNLAEKLVKIADPKPNSKILEPSAGQGAIINAINDYCNPSKIYCYELMHINQSFLTKIKNVDLVGEDFLIASLATKYDVIIANPPFNKNQDILHIYKMYDLLEKNGTLVTLCSKHYVHSSAKKEKAFEKWLLSVNAVIEEIPAGTFKESGTNIETLLIVISKYN